MKRMFRLIVTIGMLAMLVGCGNDDDATSPVQELEQTQKSLKQKMAEVGDELFWASAATAANLISATYNANHEYAVSITIDVSDGKSYVVERRVFISMISDDLRKLYRVQLLLELARDEKVVKAYDIGENVTVSGSCLKWYEFDEHDRVRELVEVYDMDNDGFWDPEYDGA